MLEIFKTQEQQKQFVDTYQDPFKSDKIECVSFWVRKNAFCEGMSVYAHIDFVNGNTKGEHKIIAADFQTLVRQVDEFIKSLK